MEPSQERDIFRPSGHVPPLRPPKLPTVRIGFDAKRLYCNRTGLGNYSRTLAGDLARYHPEGDYHLYTPRLPQDSPGAAFAGDTRFETHVSTAAIKAYWRSYGVVSDLRADGVDVYHGLSHELPFSIGSAPVRSVVTVHDLIFRKYPDTFSWFDRQVFDRKLRYACVHADLVVAISESTRRDLIEAYGVDERRVRVVYQSCGRLWYGDIEGRSNDSAVIAALPQDLPREFLLSVGSVETRKNLKLLVEAYRVLRPNERLPVVVVGRHTRYQDEVEALAQACGVADLFTFLPNLRDDRALKHLYQRAAALIYPSLYEGFGLPVAEALLCGTPVITSDVSSLPEAGGPGSLYVDPTDPEALADAVRQVLGNEALREQMVMTGRAYALERFDPERLTGQVHGIYHEVVG